MSKQSKSKQAPAIAAFAVGDYVTVSMPDTPLLGGQIDSIIPSGWAVVQLTDDSLLALDGDTRVKEGKISCRARSLTKLGGTDAPATDAPDSGAPEGDEAEEKVEHPMAKALREARVRYVKTKRPEGTTSADCGDSLARTLRDLEPLEVAALADKVLGEAAGYHAGKYGHLNPGQIRMNSGNRIRAFLKTADVEGLEHAHKALGWADEAGMEADEGEEEEGSDE